VRDSRYNAQRHPPLFKMAELHFTQNLRRHTECPSTSMAAGSVAELLRQYFSEYPDVQSYVLDDQGQVRKHVKILVDGRNIVDRKAQSDAVDQDSQVHVFQALSGG